MVKIVYLSAVSLLKTRRIIYCLVSRHPPSPRGGWGGPATNFQFVGVGFRHRNPLPTKHWVEKFFHVTKIFLLHEIFFWKKKFEKSFRSLKQRDYKTLRNVSWCRERRNGRFRDFWRNRGKSEKSCFSRFSCFCLFWQITGVGWKMAPWPFCEKVVPGFRQLRDMSATITSVTLLWSHTMEKHGCHVFHPETP